MGLFQAFNISASGMTAERFRTDIIAEKITFLTSKKANDVQETIEEEE